MTSPHLIIGILAWLGLLALAISSLSQANESRLPWAGFFAVFAVALVAFRWIPLTFNDEISVDEAQILAQAIKYRVDPIPWRSVDGTTSGPLNTYVLMWAPLVNVPLSWFASRLTGLFCIIGTIVFFACTSSLTLGRRYSLFVTLPLATFYLFTSQIEYVNFTSEHFPIFLLMMAAWMVLKSTEVNSLPLFFCLGVILGAVPFAKLQAAPLAVYFGVAALVIIVVKARNGAAVSGLSRAWKPLSVLCTGSLVVPCAILIPVAMGGVWADFVNRYILAGLNYSYVPRSRLRLLWLLVVENRDALAFLVSIAAASLYAVVYFLKKSTLQTTDMAQKIGMAVVSGYFFLNTYVILKGRFQFGHYLLFLIIASMLVALWLLRAFLSIEASRDRLLPLSWLAVAIVPQALWWSYKIHTVGEEVAALKVEENLVVEFITQHTSPGDFLGIWGWSPAYNVKTGLPSSSRDSVGAYPISKGSQWDYYREQYLSDLKKNPPKIFVDTVQEARWFNWPPAKEARFTMYPPLAEYIYENFTLASVQQLHPDREPVLIYVRNW